MRRRNQTSRIEGGGTVQQLGEARFTFASLDLLTAHERIDQPTDWQIHDHRHTFVVHLGGRMDELETEMDGHGGCVGPATPGEVWSVPAGRRYASHARGRTIHYAVFSLNPRITNDPVQNELSPFDITPVAGQRDDTLFELTRQLLNVVSREDDISKLHADTLTHEVANHLTRHYSLNQNGAPFDYERVRLPQLTDKTTQALRDFIFDNLSERISLDSLARIAGLTVHHLLIAFRKSFGTTPAQYIISQRLRRVVWLLIHTNEGITEIALTTGFASHSHLTTAFTHRFGYPPSDFRAQHS